MTREDVERVDDDAEGPNVFEFEVELYACNGHYDVVHGHRERGCGTVFAAGTGEDDIYEEDIVVEEAPGPNGMLDSDMVETYTFKGFCPHCELENVIVVFCGATSYKERLAPLEEAT